MDTDTLIRTLSEDVKPVARHAVGRRIGLGLVAGGIVTVALIGWALGFRPDFDVAMQSYHFWMKWIYCGTLAACAITATTQLARPEPARLRWLWVLAVPILLVAVIGAFEMMHVPSSDWLAMWLGASWRVCPLIVLILSMPIFIGLLWSYRKMAPTRLRAAGAAAGLAAGAFAATLYCLHCPEVSAIFVLTWYTLGMGLAAAFGALVGPRLLRW